MPVREPGYFGCANNDAIAARMTVPTSLELLAEFDAAKVAAKALFRRSAKNMPRAVAITRQAIQDDLGDLPHNVCMN